MRREPYIVLLAFLALTANVLADSSLSPRKRSASDNDINAIGHRRIVRGFNFYSVKREEEIGKEVSEEAEHSTKFVTDPMVTAYVARVAQTVAQNSDADMLIHVRVVDREEPDACTLPGGYQYVTRGLLLRMESESELASVLARGIAHTALHIGMIQLSEAALAELTTIPPLHPLPALVVTCVSHPLRFSLLSLLRQQELDADFFGMQYVYKAGYDEESFVRFVQQAWSANSQTTGPHEKMFGPFPPLPLRLTALRKEITDLLPRRDGSIVSTSEFQEFQEHLRAWRSSEPRHDPAMPVLIRHDEDSQ